MNPPAFKILCYNSLDSTNEEAKRLLSAGRIAGLTLIRAEQQTSGRGTQGRTWISPPGAGLYLSIIHPFERLESTDAMPDVAHIPVTPIFTLAAGVACAEILFELTGLKIHLKPVNDLYVAGCKLGGILTEGLLGQEQGRSVCRAIVTGIGINIYAHEAVETGCQTDTRANQPTSLQACISPQLFDRWQGEAMMDELSQALIRAVDDRYRQLIDGDTPGIVRDYLQSKLPGMELPIEIARLLPPGCLPAC
ncbi:MAG TPA: biotin--[acetyl-CoA-carboxylase] ligase [Coleofasciculaceae cyanobacterium]|jgi:biotin-[acetyl-CoA-carboxylase] ligase BirA-like protein